MHADHQSIRPGQPATPTRLSRSEKKRLSKVAAGTLVGTTIEWYDFGIYALAGAIVFPHVFFPNLDGPIAVLASMVTLAAGSIARPLGAIIFGHIGDRLGRKRALVLSIAIMGVATMLIGCIPDFAAIGALAPALLLFLRLVQSLAVGGEWGGSILFGVESAPPKLRAFFGSFTQMGSGLGEFLAAGAFSLVGLLGDDILINWAWRIPFLASGALVILGLWIRSTLDETSEFTSAAAQEANKELPIKAVLRTSWRELLLSLGAFLIPIAGYYVVVSFMSAYAAQELTLTSSQISAAVMVASLVSVIFTPIVAIVADRYGVRKVTIIGLALHLVVAAPMFMLADIGTFWGLVSGMSLGMFVSTIAYTTIGTLVAGWFPTMVRMTGLSLGYQLAGMLAGGLGPVLNQGTFVASGNWHMVAWIFAGMSAVSLACVLFKRSGGTLEMTGEIRVLGGEELAETQTGRR